MLKSQREQLILSFIKENGGFADVKTLCTKLYASESSIRRDLARMESTGLIERSYGGAKLNGNYSTIINFNERFNQSAYEKTIIAKKAVKLIADNSIVFLDQSTTSFFLAKELPNKSTLTVITNNGNLNRGGLFCCESRNCEGADHYYCENESKDLLNCVFHNNLLFM